MADHHADFEKIQEDTIAPRAILANKTVQPEDKLPAGGTLQTYLADRRCDSAKKIQGVKISLCAILANNVLSIKTSFLLCRH